MNERLTAPDAERAVIEFALEATADWPGFRELEPTDFTVFECRSVWGAAVELAAEGTDPSPPTVRTRLSEQGMQGVADQVYSMAAKVFAEDPKPHMAVVHDRSLRRRLVEAARDAAGRAEDLTVSPTDLVDYAERQIFAVGERRMSKRPQRVKAYLMPVMGLIESGGYKGTPTGFTDLDSALTGGGFLAGQLITLAGSTSMGKTALALGMASNMSIDQGTPVAYFSIEMTEEQNTLRLLAMEARADLKALTEGKPTDHDFANLSTAAAHLNQAPLYMHAGARTLPAIRAEARRLKAEEPELAVVFVDHIHDMEYPAESRREQMGAIARGLKDIAMEIGVAVVAVAQLRRVGDRNDLRPRLSDLKESGDIENSTDVAILIHRPEYYLSDEDARNQGVAGKAEAIIGKQRNGPTPTVNLTWVRHCARFDSHHDTR